MAPLAGRPIVSILLLSLTRQQTSFSLLGVLVSGIYTAISSGKSSVDSRPCCISSSSSWAVSGSSPSMQPT
ncbi:hypothetical protein BX667DRAFT_503614 [Coemansia mojavensis]|nr:hypothetical protein BX667DRAFT_503614 [Coemansia mojavensis]